MLSFADLLCCRNLVDISSKNDKKSPEKERESGHSDDSSRLMKRIEEQDNKITELKRMMLSLIEMSQKIVQQNEDLKGQVEKLRNELVKK
jgi:small-conductance mechanosensitive channel